MKIYEYKSRSFLLVLVARNGCWRELREHHEYQESTNPLPTDSGDAFLHPKSAEY